MRYRIEFAGGQVGQSTIAPFEIDTSDQLGVSARVSDLTRQIRGRVAAVLAHSPAPGAADARGVIEQNTQIVVMLRAGEGAAYYGGTTLGRFLIRLIP